MKNDVPFGTRIPAIWRSLAEHLNDYPVRSLPQRVAASWRDIVDHLQSLTNQCCDQDRERRAREAGASS